MVAAFSELATQLVVQTVTEFSARINVFTTGIGASDWNGKGLAKC